MSENYPKIGVAILVLKRTDEGTKVLLGKRKGSHGAGVYAFPGGSLEYMETLEQCIYREMAEEVGLQFHFHMDHINFIRVKDLMDYAPKHFVDMAFKIEWLSGEPLTMEPDKNEGWGWYDINNLPKPLFPTIEEIITAYYYDEEEKYIR